MKKYKNVKAIKARKCKCYDYRSNKNYDSRIYCLGVSEPFANPTCNGYKCKCTEYKYDRKEGRLK